MNTQKDGGLAFPVVMSTDTHSPTIEDGPKRLENGYGYIASVGGMTLRQWYKGKALSFLADSNINPGPEWVAAYVATIADAMLAEDAEHARKEQEK